MTSLKCKTLLAAFAALAVLSPQCTAQEQEPLRFAVIGDFGQAGSAEQDVATMVKSWKPDFIITTGDNNYDYGAAATIDENIGQYYHQFIFPYRGSYGAGDTLNRFFPSLGNHDWRTAHAAPYLGYFTLPGNGRYYDVGVGNVHLFALDSDPQEPDGVTSTSAQARWLKARLAASRASWNIVYFHHPPYSSGTSHGSTPGMRWPFREWGATAVLSGHEHNYERLVEDSLVYFVNGAGGKSLYAFGTPIPGSRVRYNSDYGAMLVESGSDSIVFRFINRKGAVIDSLTLTKKTVQGLGWNPEGTSSPPRDPVRSVAASDDLQPDTGDRPADSPVPPRRGRACLIGPLLLVR
jgi:tartrate-resistant acid phosphatase type 5